MGDNTYGKKERGFLNHFLFPLMVALLGGGIFSYYQFFHCPETKDVIGYVKKRQGRNKDAVVKANIEITSDKIGRRTTTDVDGKFIFEDIPAFDSIDILVTFDKTSTEFTRAADFCAKRPQIELEEIILEQEDENYGEKKKMSPADASSKKEKRPFKPPFSTSSGCDNYFAEYIINDLKGNLFCCWRKGNNVACRLGISREIEGLFQVCASNTSWNSYLSDDLGNKYTANEIEWNGKRQKRCIEVDYLRGMGEIKVELNFEEVNPAAKKVAKLEVSTAIGVLVYRNIPIQ